MIGIVDYGMGNIKSVSKALEYLNIPWVLSSDIEELDKCQKLILPGVGAFKKAMENLDALNLTDYLKECNKPLLGICLGMQLLFDCSFEDGYSKGLGLISGNVIHIKEGLLKENIYMADIKIPHMGWNTVNGKHYYFVHSYFADCKDTNVIGYANYYIKLPAIVQNGKGNVKGCQFHPEKSGMDGLEILKDFGGI